MRRVVGVAGCLGVLFLVTSCVSLGGQGFYGDKGVVTISEESTERIFINSLIVTRWETDKFSGIPQKVTYLIE